MKEVPFRYRTPVEAVLLDMLQCSRPRCYLLGVMMRQHYRPTQSAPTVRWSLGWKLKQPCPQLGVSTATRRLH